MFLGGFNKSEGQKVPVLAPDGTAARNKPKSVTRSTSTVGLPLESKMLRARMLLIGMLSVKNDYFASKLFKTMLDILNIN